MTTVGNIRYEQEEEETSSVVIVIAVIVSVCVFMLILSIFIIILGYFWRISRRKDQKLDELQMTLSKMETNVAHECKEGWDLPCVVDLSTNLLVFVSTICWGGSYVLNEFITRCRPLILFWSVQLLRLMLGMTR